MDTEQVTSYPIEFLNSLQLSGVPSYKLRLTVGVPVLGPLLFLIYINDISTAGLTGHISLYADDTCLFYFGDSIADVISEAQKDLNVLNVWLSQNLLTMNVTKTAYIIFAAKNKKIPSFPDLTINNQPLRKSTHEKYLGLIVDSKLTFRAHIDYVRSRILPLTGAIRNIAKCVPYKLRHTIYNTLVKPHLEYLIQVWGQAAKTNQQHLQRTQNKIIKILFNYNYYTPTELLYKKTKLLNLQQLYTYHTCMTIRKILKTNIHTNISFTQKTHRYNTRNQDDLEVPRVRTLYGRKTIQYEGVRLYNKLPKKVRECTSIPTFKKGLMNYIIDT